MTDPNNQAFCTRCRRYRTIIDSFEDSIPERFAEEVVWVVVLECEHDEYTRTGEAHRYPTDPSQVVQ